MIDGIKLRLTNLGTQQRVRAHHLLTDRWRYKGKGKSGHDKYTAKWNGWILIGDETRCWAIRGSFHKFHQGGTNWQDYTFTQFLETVATLCDAFGLHAAGLSIATLEVGVNIVPPIPTRDVLRAIVLHKDKAPTPMREGRGIEIAHAAYRYKIYDKAHQNRLPGELLRFELKATRMRPLQPLGVRTVADLLNRATWHRLEAFLVFKFNELLIVDPNLPTDAMRPAQCELVAKASAPAYWQAMENNRARRYRCRKALEAIHAQHAPHGLKASLRTAIEAKLSDLLNGDECHKGSTAAPEVPRVTNATRGQRTTAHPSEGEMVTNATQVVQVAFVTPKGSGSGAIVDRDEMPPAEVRRCPVCGRDISHQHPRSNVCSERLYGKAGKRCRNTLSNRALTFRRMDARGGLLFDQRPYVRPALKWHNDESLRTTEGPELFRRGKKGQRCPQRRSNTAHA